MLRFFSSCCAAILAAAGPGFQDPAPPQTEADHPIAIRPLAGDLLIWRGKGRKTERIRAPSTLSPLDRTGSPKGAASRFSVDAGVQVSLVGVTAGPNDGLSVSRPGKKIRLRLYRGRVLVESLESDVTVATDQGTAQGKAAYFLVEATGKSTRIVAFDGRLKVSNDLGGVVLEPGETGQLDAKKPPVRRPTTTRDIARAAPLEAPANLVTNPGFENNLETWEPMRTAARHLVRVDEQIVRSGRRSARLQISGVDLATEARPIRQSAVVGEAGCALFKVQEKCLREGDRYLLKFWFRTEGLSRGGEAVPFAVYRADDIRSPADGFSHPCPPADGRWRCARFVFTADGPDFLIYLPRSKEGARYEGTIWVDDVFLTRLGPPPEDPPD